MRTSLLLVMAMLTGSLHASPAAPPNLVALSEQLVTSGQPSADWLDTLRDEPLIVARQAYEQVARVWTPSGPWKTLMLDQLRQHQINFDPF